MIRIPISALLPHCHQLSEKKMGRRGRGGIIHKHVGLCRNSPAASSVAGWLAALPRSTLGICPSADGQTRVSGACEPGASGVFYAKEDSKGDKG